MTSLQTKLYDALKEFCEYKNPTGSGVIVFSSIEDKYNHLQELSRRAKYNFHHHGNIEDKEQG